MTSNNTINIGYNNKYMFIHLGNCVMKKYIFHTI